AAPQRQSRAARVTVLATLVAAGGAVLAAPLIDSRWPAVGDALRSAVDRVPVAAETAAPAPATVRGDDSGPTPDASMPPKMATDAKLPQEPVVAPTEASAPSTA